MKMSAEINQIKIDQFIQVVRDFYISHGRFNLPWRLTQDPYQILVSEVMLQQTQVERVIPKYVAFMKQFPTTASLTTASMTEVLLLWKGLGYNRRALYLKQTAEIIETRYSGQFPKEYNKLLTLPGIGPATAGDLLAFAWNIPHVVIETNIRTAIIHHFFPDQQEISDKQLAHIVEATLDQDNPREWYWALLDYGAMLKKEGLNRNSQSKHHQTQSTFEGSNRQLRSHILQLILNQQPISVTKIKKQLISHPQWKHKSTIKINKQISDNLKQMAKEGLIHQQNEQYIVS